MKSFCLVKFNYLSMWHLDLFFKDFQTIPFLYLYNIFTFYETVLFWLNDNFCPVSRVIYHELVLTTKEYMREVTAMDPKWLVEFAPKFFKFSDPTRLSKQKKQQKIEPLYNKYEDPNSWRISRAFRKFHTKVTFWTCYHAFSVFCVTVRMQYSKWKFHLMECAYAVWKKLGSAGAERPYWRILLTNITNKSYWQTLMTNFTDKHYQ